MGFWDKLLAWIRAGDSTAGPQKEVPSADSQPTEEDCRSRPVTPHEDAHFARQAFVRGDLRQAVRHVACALSADPQRREWLELFDAIIGSASDPLSLVPETGALSVADGAARAYVLARLGSCREAIQLLAKVTRLEPDTRYVEAWALPWLDTSAALSSLDQDTFALFVAATSLRYPEHWQLARADREFLQRLLETVERYENTGRMDTNLRVWYAALLRKLGRFDEAVQLTERTFLGEPGWVTAIAAATALRHRGDRDKAIEMYKRALEFDPHDLSVPCDIGDMYFDDRDWEQACGWYERILDRSPGHSWALPSAYYCRYKATGDLSWLERLADLVRDETNANSRAASLIQLLHPYTGFLPEPTDATANFIRQLAEQIQADPANLPQDVIKLTVSCLESPSNQLALAKQMEVFGVDCQLELHVEKIPDPDPREPFAPVEYLLWEYEGTTARPALPCPSDRVAQIVAQLAAQPYDYEGNWRAASALAGQLDAEQVDELAAVMVHPPPIVGDVSALAWVPRVQLAAAQVIAHMDRGWQGSLRRKALLDIARGPLDWTTEAAIVALAQLASEEERARPEVRQLFRQLLDRVPQGGHCNFIPALLYSWLTLPELPADERDDVKRMLEHWCR